MAGGPRVAEDHIMKKSFVLGFVSVPLLLPLFLLSLHFLLCFSPSPSLLGFPPPPSSSSGFFSLSSHTHLAPILPKETRDVLMPWTEEREKSIPPSIPSLWQAWRMWSQPPSTSPPLASPLPPTRSSHLTTFFPASCLCARCPLCRDVCLISPFYSGNTYLSITTQLRCHLQWERPQSEPWGKIPVPCVPRSWCLRGQNTYPTGLMQFVLVLHCRPSEHTLSRTFAMPALMTYSLLDHSKDLLRRGCLLCSDTWNEHLLGISQIKAGGPPLYRVWTQRNPGCSLDLFPEI